MSQFFQKVSTSELIATLASPSITYRNRNERVCKEKAIHTSS